MVPESEGIGLLTGDRTGRDRRRDGKGDGTEDGTGDRTEDFLTPSGWFDETSDDSKGMYACI